MNSIALNLYPIDINRALCWLHGTIFLWLHILAYYALRMVGVSHIDAVLKIFGPLLKEALARAVKEVGADGLDAVLDRLRKEIWALVGFVPDEGETLAGNLLFKRILTDRDADMELGLFTNVAPGETITEATITEPTGGGYARINLTDATWTNAPSDTFGYAMQTFTAGAGGYSGSIQGYFIATKAAGGTQRLAVIEVDSNGPYTMNQNDTYDITPSNVVA